MLLSVLLFQLPHVLFLCISPCSPPPALIWDQRASVVRGVLGKRLAVGLSLEEDSLTQACTLKRICQFFLLPLIFPPSEALKLLSSVFTRQWRDAAARRRHEK